MFLILRIISNRTVLSKRPPSIAMSFTDKVVIVTGASSGIGAAIAVKFCEEGAKVTLVGRNQDKLRAVLEKCQNTSGGKTHVIVADVTNESEAKKIVDETLKEFGKIDILINNAGVAGRASIFEENIMQVYDKVMTTNLRSVVHMTSLCAKHLVETKGNVVNISSVASTVTSTSLIYCASKAGLDHFTRCVALELAPTGVRVNAVNPGPVKTDIVENMGMTGAHEDAVWEAFKKATALGRIGEPEEIADLVLFVESDKSRSITGASMVSDNGVILKGFSG